MENKEFFVTKVGKILSRQKSADRYTLVSIFKPEDPEQRKHGVLYFIIEILSNDPSMGRVAKIIEKAVIDKYYENLNLEDSLSSLEDSLKAVNEKLSELADEGEVGWIGKINGVIAALEGNILHVTQTGTVESYLVRDNKIVHITEGLSSAAERPNPLKTFLNIASGEMKLGDKIIISTSELFYHFSLDDLRRINMKFAPAIAAAYIVKMLRKENIESINTLILELSDNDDGENRLANLGEKIWGEEGKIIEQYNAKLVPFWKSFLKISKKGVATSVSKSKEIYGDKIAPGVSKFAQEASKRVNEKVSEISQSKEIEQKEEKRSKSLFSKKKDRGDQQDIFDIPQKNLFTPLSKATKDISSGAKNAAKSKAVNQLIAVAAVLLLVLIIVSGLVSYQKRATYAKKEQAEKQYLAVKTKTESAIKAHELGDSRKAQSLLEEAKKEIADISKSSYFISEIGDLEKQIANSMEWIFNIKRYDDIEPMADFNTLDSTESMKNSELFRIDNKLYTTDIERHKGAFVSLENPEEISFINELTFDGAPADTTLLATNKSNVILINNSPNGVYIYNSKTNQTSKMSQMNEEAWPQAKAVGSYLTNIYLLVPGENQIYKYVSLGNNYSTKSNYILSPSEDLSDAVDIAIDGFIYVLKKNGEILKYLSGERVDFVLTNMPSNANEKEKDEKAKMVSASKMITGENIPDIYIADSGAGRIVVFDKEGRYQTQYISSKWNDIKDFWVSLDNRKLYILSGTKIYQVEI